MGALDGININNSTCQTSILCSKNTPTFEQGRKGDTPSNQSNTPSPVSPQNLTFQFTLQSVSYHTFDNHEELSLPIFPFGGDTDSFVTNMISFNRLYELLFSGLAATTLGRLLNLLKSIAFSYLTHEGGHISSVEGGVYYGIGPLSFTRTGIAPGYYTADWSTQSGGFRATEALRKKLGMNMSNGDIYLSDSSLYFLASFDPLVQLFYRLAFDAQNDISNYVWSLNRQFPTYNLKETHVASAIVFQMFDPMLAFSLAHIIGQISGNEQAQEIPFFYPLGKTIGFFPFTGINFSPFGPEYKGGFYLRLNLGDELIAGNLYGRGNQIQENVLGGGGAELERIPTFWDFLKLDAGFHFWGQPPIRYKPSLPIGIPQKFFPEEPKGFFYAHAGARLNATNDLSINIDFGYKQPGFFETFPLGEVLRFTLGLAFSL